METKLFDPWGETARAPLVLALANTLEAVRATQKNPSASIYAPRAEQALVALLHRIQAELDLETSYRLSNGISNLIIRCGVGSGSSDDPVRALSDHLYEISTPLTDMRFMAVPTVEEWNDLVEQGRSML